jgi:3-hydroxyisobutyrate dehydrogenase-like beta-hydroxyacid dehydrogenase
VSSNSNLTGGNATIGFIGLGVMGEPMCRNLAQKTGRRVIGFDRTPEPLARLREVGVVTADSIEALARECGVVFMALPSGKHVESVCEGPSGLLANVRPGSLVVDLGTSPVDLTRSVAERFARIGVMYADAPIARTRQAAETGTLSIMVGADQATFDDLKPLLAAFATDITLCGATGAGQIVKILNNMVLIETVVALSEAIAIARRSGVDGKILFETLMKGSADSFALRNHGMKAVLPGTFPERAFSTDYARKDLSYALSLGKELGLRLQGAETADGLLRGAAESGYSQLYWPVISRIVDSDAGSGPATG